MKRVQLGSRMIFKNGLGDICEFGKYKSQIVKWKFVIDNDPSYIQWLFDNVDSFDLDNEAKIYWRDKMLGVENG